jgi:hypothetical protein
MINDQWSMNSRRPNIGMVLIAFIVLGVAYSLATPIFEKPDEMWHLAYIKRLVDGQGYPDAPRSISDDAPSQESSQPPLYYTLAALVVRTFAPDTSDLHTRLTHNPREHVKRRTTTRMFSCTPASTRFRLRARPARCRRRGWWRYASAR